MPEYRIQNPKDARQKTKGGFFCLLFFIWVMLVFVGCGPKVQMPMRICPGAESAAAAVSIQKQHFENAVAFRANGQCFLRYYDEQNKRRNESFPVKLWAAPPRLLYLQGDVAFNPKGIVLGSSRHEFWLLMKPKEISSYVWGRWSQQSCFEEMMINPALLLEALGIARFDSDGYWSLSNSGPFDILTKRQAAGIVIKVYIYSCDRSVRKIEYLDNSGKILVLTELDGYKPVSQDFEVPSVIKIERYGRHGRGDSVSITLGSIKPVQLTQKQQSLIFTRPEPAGFEYIYKLDENCDFIRLQRND